MQILVNAVLVNNEKYTE